MKNFVHKKDNDSTSAGVVTAAEYNSFLGELKSAVSDYFSLSDTDSTQLRKALYMSARSNFYHDTGTVNNVVLRTTGERQAQTVHSDGMVVMFQALHANTGPMTVKLEGMAAYPAKWKGLDIPPGGMEAGGKYIVVFREAGGGEWDIDELTTGGKYKPNGVVSGDIAAHGVPTATVIAMPTDISNAAVNTTLDNNYLFCNGASVAVSDFPKLFVAIGATFGASGTGAGRKFNLPDYRGVFLRGNDHGRGLDGDKGRHYNTLQLSANLVHLHNRTFDGYKTISTQPDGDGHVDYHSSIAHPRDLDYHSQVTGASGGSESRPVNMTVKYLIKYT